MVVQLEDANSYPIAPFTLASGVTLSNYNKNLQEQVDFMNIDVINGEKEEVEDDINGTTNETVDSIHEVMGNGKNDILSISASCFNLDEKIFPITFTYTITLTSDVNPYKENITANISEYDNRDSLLKSVIVKKKINNNVEKIIYNPKKPKVNFSFENQIEGGHEYFTFSTETNISKKGTTSTNRYLIFFGASPQADINNVVVDNLSKRIVESTTYSLTIRTKLDDYVWILVPNSIQIRTIKSNGFDFSFKSTGNYNVNNLGTYRVYRSTEPLKDATWTLDIT